MDPVTLLTLADRLKSLRTQQITLANANPTAAIVQMQKTHAALVAYAKLQQESTKFVRLSNRREGFYQRESTNLLGQAVQGLATAIK